MHSWKREKETFGPWPVLWFTLFSLASIACSDEADSKLVSTGSAFAQQSTTERLLELAAENPLLQLDVGRHADSDATVLLGTYRVFVLHGGPGAAATTYIRSLADSWLREKRDIVLVDQRGTGHSNPLQVTFPAGEQNLQAYFEPVFIPVYFEAALPRLEQIADLTKYTTPIAMDDLNEVRAALGYEKINLRGGSYGSRAALVYMRRHPETVRTATLNGIAPISFLNPLFHAASAQEGLEALAAEIEADVRYRNLFPDIPGMVDRILARLEESPAKVTVPHSSTQQPTEITLDRDGFAEALRVLMYYTPTNRQVPALLLRADAGDYVPFAQRGLESNRGIRSILSFGMLMCVTGSEDIPRIDPATIPKLTENTFLGDTRVRMQMAVAEIWPRAEVPPDYGKPVDVDVPVLLLSGTHDPVTPPRWGATAASHLPASLHLIVPGAHGVRGAEVTGIEKQFLETGSTKGLDVSAIAGMRLPPLHLPQNETPETEISGR